MQHPSFCFDAQALAIFCSLRHHLFFCEFDSKDSGDTNTRVTTGWFEPVERLNINPNQGMYMDVYSILVSLVSFSLAPRRTQPINRGAPFSLDHVNDNITDDQNPAFITKQSSSPAFPDFSMAAANVMAQQSSPVMPKSHVGFDSITQQIERKLLKRGFQFNVICVGVS